jgi:hypothetical protein
MERWVRLGQLHLDAACAVLIPIHGTQLLQCTPSPRPMETQEVRSEVVGEGIGLESDAHALSVM